MFTSLKETGKPEWIHYLEDRTLYVDNYLEGFHIPYVHSDLNDVLSYDDYETEIFENGVLQGMMKIRLTCLNHQKIMERKLLPTTFGFFPINAEFLSMGIICSSYFNK